MEVSPESEIIARFESNEGILNGRPAATRKFMGKGFTVKLAFWPKEDSLWPLLQEMIGGTALRLNKPAPPGIQAVPRRDGSLFVVNTRDVPADIELSQPMRDRLSNRRFPARSHLQAFEVLWLE
jgi:hypothetical protein